MHNESELIRLDSPVTGGFGGFWLAIGRNRSRFPFVTIFLLGRCTHEHTNRESMIFFRFCGRLVVEINTFPGTNAFTPSVELIYIRL